jgi:hypothetical protein
MLNAQADGSIFAPFASNLKAHASGSRVELSWTDSPSVRGETLIYRSRTPFSPLGEPGGEQYAKVFYGRENFVDEVPTMGKVYYLVVSTGTDGEKYEMVIPYHNMVELTIDGRESIVMAGAAPPAEAASGGVTGLTRPQPAEGQGGGGIPDKAGLASGAAPYYQPYGTTLFAPPDAVQTPAPQAQPKLVLTGLTAYPEGSGVKISFISGNGAKNVVIYRSNAPITRVGDLLSAQLIHLPGARSPFVDGSVQAGLQYYYAVVYDEDVRAGAATISPPYNATILPVRAGAAQEGEPAAATLRALPHTVSTQDGSVATVRPEGKLSAEAAAALADDSFTGTRPFQSPLPSSRNADEPQIFKADLQESPEGGNERRLQNIVKGPFVWRNWKEAEEALRRLLAGVNDPAIEGRARFYLGQAHYFSGEAGKALTEFLAVQSRFPKETSLWIRSALDKLSNK